MSLPIIRRPRGRRSPTLLRAKSSLTSATGHMPDEDEVSIVRMLFSIPLIARMPNVESTEFLHEVFPAVIDLIEAALPKLACAAFADISTIVKSRPEFTSDETVGTVLQAVQAVLPTSDSSQVIERVVYLARESFQVLDRIQWKACLYAGLDNPVTAQDNSVHNAIFESITVLVFALPEPFCRTLGPFVEDLGSQLEPALVNAASFTVLWRVGMAFVVTNFEHEPGFEMILRPVSGHFDDLLLQGYQTTSSCDGIFAIAAHFLRCPKRT